MQESKQQNEFEDLQRDFRRVDTSKSGTWIGSTKSVQPKRISSKSGRADCDTSPVSDLRPKERRIESAERHLAREPGLVQP